MRGGSLHEPKQLPHQYSSPFVHVEMNSQLARLCAQNRFERRGVGGVSGLVPVKKYPRDEAKAAFPPEPYRETGASDSLTGLTLPGPPRIFSCKKMAWSVAVSLATPRRHLVLKHAVIMGMALSSALGSADERLGSYFYLEFLLHGFRNNFVTGSPIPMLCA